MMISTFFKHLWESLKNLRRNGWMTIAAVSSVTITLVLVGIFLSVILNTAKLVTDIQKNVQVIAYLNLDTHDDAKQIPNKDDKSQMVDNPDYHKIYDEISKVEHVKKVTFSDKDQQLDKLIKTLGNTWKIYKGDGNPLHDVYEIEVDEPKNVEAVSKLVKGLEGIEKSEFGGTNTKKLFSFANVIRTWGAVGAILLLFIAVFLISNTIRITILSRQREIQIMRLVGAKNGYIRWPFFLEGAWIGLLGAVIPSVILYFVYRIAYQGLAPSLVSQNIHMYAPSTFIPQIIGLMALIGVLIGAVGSIMSMRRFLKI